MATQLSELAPLGHALMLLVMGPGLGESVLVRWPPDNWLVIDSFRRTTRHLERHPAIDALQLFDGYADAVALTHPHEDHTSGFASLIERRKPGGVVGWWPAYDGTTRWSTANAHLATRQGSNEQALAAIDRVWREEPESRWILDPQSQPLHIGGATIQVLTPLPATLAHCAQLAKPDYNEMSSAMLLTWEGCRILLGADLVNRRGWASLEAEHGPLSFADTAAMKVAHHGSKEAQHPVALGEPPPSERAYLATPYNRGRKVPDYRDGEDVQSLLAVMHRLLISSHHGPRPAYAGIADTSRTQLLPSELGLGPLTVDVEGPVIDVGDCWVATRWAADGTVLSVDRGLGSMSVIG